MDYTRIGLVGAITAVATGCNIDPRDDGNGLSGSASDTSTGPATSASASGTTGASTTAASTTAASDGSTGPDASTTANTGPLLDVGTDEDPIIPDAACDEITQTASNQGCEFWAVDLPNVWGDPEDQQFAVVVANTGGATADVRVYEGSSDNSVLSATVEPGETHEFLIDSQSIENRGNSTDGVAYRVASDHPITAYQFNPLDNAQEVFSNDASLLFPTHVLGLDYHAVTGDAVWINNAGTTDVSGAFVSAVAVEDDTVVQIFPTADLYTGQIAVTLQRGQVATWISEIPVPFPPGHAGNAGQGNLSGSRVTSDKPVAVFSGNVATIEPQPGKCCADHMEHQMLPLVAWGTSYLAAPVPDPDNATPGDLTGYRITGAFDGTTLVYDPVRPGGAPTVIDAGETVRFEASGPFVVSTDDDTKPFALTQFLLSSEYLERFGEMGDPAMIAIPASAQFQGRYIVSVPSGYANNYVTIYRPEGTDVAIDDNLLDSETWYPLATLSGEPWEYAHVALQAGAYRVEAQPDDQPIGIISVGYSDFVSYGYPGGSGIEIISDPPPPAG